MRVASRGLSITLNITPVEKKWQKKGRGWEGREVQMDDKSDVEESSVLNLYSFS